MCEKPYCLSCECCLPIGMGDHFCDYINKLVIDEYEPNENYGACNGEGYSEIE